MPYHLATPQLAGLLAAPVAGCKGVAPPEAAGWTGRMGGWDAIVLGAGAAG